MWLGRKHLRVLVLAAVAFAWSGVARADVELAKSGGWTFSTDGRVNGFVSHLWGDNRPKGLESMAWVGYNETGSSGQAEQDGSLRRTRIRSGFVPTTLAFNVKRRLTNGLNVAGRIEFGFQIANIQPVAVANPTWMDPRDAYLELSGDWGSVRVGRALGLFSRGNLFMNYELGHAYGVGFPCSYEYVFGGACGHVGFGTLWPDFHAQLTYTTPNIADVLQVSLGVFDPRTVPTYLWERIPLPRVESEAVAKHFFSDGWGFKAWVNGAHQRVGIGIDRLDPTTNEVLSRDVFMQDAYGVGGGLQGYLGPVKLGVSGYAGRGMDAFEFLGFNPVFVSLDAEGDNEKRKFRPTRGFLAEASVTIGSTWVMGGFGKAFLDRMPSDFPIAPRGIADANRPPLLRSQTGISAGVFHRMESIVFGIDYFNAHYGFDPRYYDPLPTTAPDGITYLADGSYVDSQQTMHFVNGGVTLEW